MDDSVAAIEANFKSASKGRGSAEDAEDKLSVEIRPMQPLLRFPKTTMIKTLSLLA